MMISMISMISRLGYLNRRRDHLNLNLTLPPHFVLSSPGERVDIHDLGRCRWIWVCRELDHRNPIIGSPGYRLSSSGDEFGGGRSWM